MHRLHLSRRVRHPNEYSVYDTKQSGGDALVMLEFEDSGVLLQKYPPWHGFLYMGQIETLCKQMTYVILNY